MSNLTLITIDMIGASNTMMIIEQWISTLEKSIEENEDLNNELQIYMEVIQYRIFKDILIRIFLF